MMNERKDLLNKTQKVIKLANEKAKNTNHGYINTLLKKLNKLYDNLQDDSISLEFIKENNGFLDGAVRAYFDTNLPESYEETFLIELGDLEMEFKK